MRERYFRLDPGTDLGVLYVGQEACLPSHRWSGRRDHALVHSVVSGRGRVRHGRKEWTLGPGDSFFFFGGTDLWYEADRDEPWTYRWAGLTGLRALWWFHRVGLRPEAPVVRARPDREVAARLAELLDLDEGQPARVQALVFALLDALADTEPSGAVAPAPYVDEIRAFVNHAYSRPLSTAALARFAGLERSYCARLFSLATGTPLMEYVARVRMDRAVELLETTDLTVKAIAASVGYPDAGAFTKRFKQVLGKTPSAFRDGEMRALGPGEVGGEMP